MNNTFNEPLLLKSLFLCKHTYSCILLIFGQAAARAGILACLLRIVDSNTGLETDAKLLGVILILVGFEYFSGFLGTYIKEAWKMYSFQRFIELSASGIKGKPSLFVDNDLKETRTGGVIGNGNEILGGAIDYVLAIVKSAAVFLFLMFTLGLLIDKWIIATMAISFFSCYVVVKKSRKVLTRKAEKAERRRVSVSRFIQSWWSNLSLGNRECSESWIDKSRLAIGQFQRSRLASVGAYVNVQGLLALISHLPTFSLLAYLFFISEMDRDQIASIAVSIPAILQSLSLLTQVVAMATSFYVLKGQFTVLFELIRPLPEQDLLSRISFDRMSLPTAMQIGENGLDRFLRDPPSSGRIEIRGSNGCGKTSLLLYIKRFLGDKAFYLPAQSDLFLGPQGLSESTGQKIRRQLEKITSLNHYKVILLDEWDANLDCDNKLLIESRLRDLSSGGILVIEARHRQSNA